MGLAVFVDVPVPPIIVGGGVIKVAEREEEDKRLLRRVGDGHSDLPFSPRVWVLGVVATTPGAVFRKRTFLSVVSKDKAGSVDVHEGNVVLRVGDADDPSRRCQEGGVLERKVAELD